MIDYDRRRGLCESVWMQDGVIHYIDETQLPGNIEIKTIQTLHDAEIAIGGLEIRALGQVLLIIYLVIDTIDQNLRISQPQLYSSIETIERRLSKVRPTFPFKDIVKPYLTVLEQDFSGTRPGLFLKDKILEDLEILRTKRIKRAEWMAELLSDKDCVLTHCNTSGDMVILANVCKKMGKSISFHVTETRPHLQGSRLTAWELADADIPVTIISDSAAARTISEGRVQVAVTGADRCALNGDIINKVGTFQIALICKAYGIPFYVMAQTPSRVATGRDITIEYRNGQEIFDFPKQRRPSDGMKALFPCFDITPAHYIDRIVNFEGIKYPHELHSTESEKSIKWV